MSYGVVVVGGGVGAGYFCRAMVAAAPKLEGGLAILSAETVAPYERPALTKAYIHPPTAKVRARLPGFHTCVGGGGDRQTPEWYKEQGIEVLTKTAVVKVDTAAKQVVTDRGDAMNYEKMLFCTGCSPILAQDVGIKSE